MRNIRKPVDRLDFHRADGTEEVVISELEKEILGEGFHCSG